MKLVTFESETGEVRVGVQLPMDGVVDIAASQPKLPSTMADLLSDIPRSLNLVAELIDKGDYVAVTPRRLLAPVPKPGKVVCIGLNYRDHAEETGAAIPTEPVVFNKFPSSIVGPGDPILLPAVSERVDYEAELVVVIGERGRNIPREKAFDYVAGYTAGHDVSARDWQIGKGGNQWLLGKTFDSFAPIGPYLVTKDEIPDPQNLAVGFRLNGQVMQKGSTSKMIFPVDELIAYLSKVFTLEPGDLIFTGTPPGVGMARNPPVFLKPGDVCDVEVEGVGILSNTCKAG
jgi:2-keto-4-pentenoate hydratase/2-oxohepta-3-ene-1,7-dioic acid hydratase in catechol pathway